MAVSDIRVLMDPHASNEEIALAAAGFLFKPIKLADESVDITKKINIDEILKNNSKYTKQPVKEYDVVPYKPSNKEFGFENHHGVMDVWAKNNIPGYKSYGKNSTAVALTTANHNATRSEFIKWRIEKTGGPAGKIDWANVSPREMQELTERLFDSAKVPEAARREYYKEFNKYIYGLE